MRLHELDLNFLKKKEKKKNSKLQSKAQESFCSLKKKKKSFVKGIKWINIQLRSQTRRLGTSYQDNWLELSLQHQSQAKTWFHTVVDPGFPPCVYQVWLVL